MPDESVASQLSRLTTVVGNPAGRRDWEIRARDKPLPRGRPGRWRDRWKASIITRSNVVIVSGTTIMYEPGALLAVSLHGMATTAVVVAHQEALATLTLDGEQARRTEVDDVSHAQAEGL